MQRGNSNPLQEFYEAIKPGYLSPRWGEPYTPLDRYRDFQKVFSNEEGRRVLSQIIDICEGKIITLNQVRDHAYLAHRMGMREVGLQITQIMLEIPVDIGDMNDE